LIGDQTAENLKKQIGVAYHSAEYKEMEVTGRKLAQGIPQSFTVSTTEILEALNEPLNGLVTAIKIALENTPPELSSDIADRGIVLTGGGALLKDLDKMISEETGIPVILADEPLTCVVRGCGMALERLENLSSIFTTE
jgi:rod shape-determining protein MreB